ncbi:MAG: RND family transporter [Rhodothermales bacterium]
MDRLFEALRPFIRGVVRRAGWVLAVALLGSGLGVYSAFHLRIDTDLSKLIPEHYTSVQALERLRATVGGGETSVDIAIESPSFEANKAFAEALIPGALKLRRGGSGEPYFVRAELRRDTEFIKDNALYFATTAELDQLETYLEDKIEEAKLEANPFFFDLEEDEEVDGDSIAQEMLATYDEIVGQEYRVSKDSTALVVRFFTGGSSTNISYIEALYSDFEGLIGEVSPASFHPQMETTLAGRLLRQKIEVRTITEDVKGSFLVGIMAVLLTVVLYFFYKAYRARSGGRFDGRVLLSELARTPVMALLIGLPLLMSLTWTFGMAYLAFGALNLMTSTLGLVLFGLGIDYGIHFYARYTEERGAGRTVMEAAERTFTSTGQAIAIGALTTAAALYILILADFRGFSEFGFIAGTGVLFALIAMTVVMPALLAVFERIRLLNLESAPASAPVREVAARRFPGARSVVLVSLGLVVAALVFSTRVEFEYRFGELEPSYPEWHAVNVKVRQAFSDRNRRNPAYVVLDSQDEVPAVLAALRKHMAQDTSRTIRSVESLQDRFPVAAETAQAKLARIADIRALLADPFLQAEASEDLDKLRRAAQPRAPIALADVPEFLKKQFTSKSGEIGNFIVIYPSVGLSDGRLSMAFADDVATIVTEDGQEYHAGSPSIVAADMLRLMQREAPWMVLATFVIVALLMWFNFRALRWALLALMPLAIGVLWMLLLMEVFGMRLNFYNLVVLPAVLGIGNDAGAHMVHRYCEEGAGSILAVLRSTGEHVTMGALTTMIGFAGLLLSFHPGLNTIGALAVVGIGTTLVSALVFLLALLQWLEDRRTVATTEPEASAAA